MKNNNNNSKLQKQEVENTESVATNKNQSEVVISVPNETTPLFAATYGNNYDTVLSVIKNFYYYLLSKLRRRNITQLHNDTLLIIFGYLPLRDRCALALTCKKFLELSKNPQLKLSSNEFNNLLLNLSGIFDVSLAYFSKTAHAEHNDYHPIIMEHTTYRFNLPSNRLNKIENKKLAHNVNVLQIYLKKIVSQNDATFNENIKIALIFSNHYLSLPKRISQLDTAAQQFIKKIKSDEENLDECLNWPASCVGISFIPFMFTCLTIITNVMNGTSFNNDWFFFSFAAIFLICCLPSSGYIGVQKTRQVIQNYKHDQKINFFNAQIKSSVKEFKEVETYFFGENEINTDIPSISAFSENYDQNLSMADQMQDFSV